MLFIKKAHGIAISFIQFQQKIRLKYSYIYDMNKAYMRKSEGADVFEFSFQYKNSELNIDRQFNFIRKLSENVDSFLGRVATNVEKIFNKPKKKNKNQGSVPVVLSDKIYLHQNGAQVSGDKICEDIFNENGDIRLTILDNQYQILINTPWVKSAVLPSSILANFPCYPSKFEMLFADKSVSEFTWFKSVDKKVWSEIAKGFIYTPTNDEINSYLKIHCLPKNEVSSGPITEVISDSKVEADPGHCPFETRHKFSQNKLSGQSFRVATYNILADLYSDSDYAKEVLFSYCPTYALNMDYRKQLILKELIGYNADLICLQEVDRKVFDNDLIPVLSHFGFSGVFDRKGTTAEGLACFHNNRFKKVESLYITFAEEIDKNPLFSDIWQKVSANENLAKKVTERSTILQTVLLESVENNEMLLVANTHFYFHPTADNIRVLHGVMAIIYLEDFKNKVSEKYGKRVTLIFCGDFNSVPECGTYKLYTTGALSEDIPDWESNADEIIEGIKLKHNTLMFSACGTPKYTNFTVGFKDCLDYIYCEKNNVEVVQVVPLPSYEELAEHIAIPSVVFPSDHISLVADLKWS